MKKTLILAVCLTASLALSATARADKNREPIPTPEVIVFELAPTPTPVMPKPTPTPEVHFTDHGISQKAIDEAASIFWADCNTDDEKLCVAAVAVNRLCHGYPFGDTLEGILEAKSEWNHGHISDRNREKAKQFLNMALTQYVDGDFAGLAIPSTALYITRDELTRKLVLLDINFKEVYRIK